ncbi:neutral protease 2-like protein [Alternaria alternata]|nr:neutral protease 2-like protein [Alternaria alternata]
MKLFASPLVAFLALSSYTIAASVNLFQTEDPLNVQLTALENTVVKVVITNTGDTTLNLLSTGTLLDDTLPVERVTLYSNSGSTRVPFEGVTIQLDPSALSADDFLMLESKGKREFAVETGAFRDLSSGGSFDVFANGVLPYANGTSTELVGALRYDSNRLSISVDGTKAAAARESLAKRTIVDSGCTGDRLTNLRTALSNCQKLASGAATAAAAGDSRLGTFFKSTSTSVRNQVSARMSAVAQDCGTSSPGTTSIVAYTLPTLNSITYCPIFFTNTIPITTGCKTFDRGTTILHETTHASSVYSPSTQDLAYGYDASVKLSTEQALNNADSYTLFANYVRLNCA